MKKRFFNKALRILLSTNGLILFAFLKKNRPDYLEISRPAEG